jgi:hypothetical protein
MSKNNTNNIDNSNDYYSIENGTTTALLDNDNLLLKMNENQIEEIKKYSNYIKYTEITCLISFLIFLLILTIKLINLNRNINWNLLDIPALIFLVSFILTINIFLIIKGLIDKIENELSTSIKAGTYFSFTIINCIGINLIIFCTLLMNYIQKSNNSKYDINNIFIPYYLALSLAIIFSIFMFYAFLQNNLYIEIVFIFGYLLTFFLFGILICLKINNKNGINEYNNIKFFHCFLPIYLILGADFLYRLFILFLEGNFNLKKIINKIMFIMSIFFCFLTGLITQLKIDYKMNNKNHYVQGILAIITYLCFSFEYFNNILMDDETEDEKI